MSDCVYIEKVAKLSEWTASALGRGPAIGQLGTSSQADEP